VRNKEVIRQWQILKDIESARTGVTIHDLANRAQVSTRTIRRDLAALQEAGFALFDEGAELETKRWKLDAQPFKGLQVGLGVQDVAALYLSRSIVEALTAWPLLDELRGALEKIESALNPKMKEFLSALPEVVSAKAAPRTGRGAQLASTTRSLLDAIRDRRISTMRYYSAGSRATKSYEVHPYRISLAQGGVYLIAWVPKYDQFRTFAVERIEKLTVSETPFRKVKELPADVFGSSLGVFSAEPERIELEFSAQVKPWVFGRTWHPSQQFEERPDGSLRMTLDVSNDWALRSWILGFGADVIVISPAPLARTIRDSLSSAAARYRRG
jgi:predicted DNA-binding transcriptional regulator YafY